MLLTLVTRMVRVGLLTVEDTEAMAAALEAEGEADAALSIRGAWVEAQAPDTSDWNAGRARARFKVVDGGNGDT